MSEFWQVGGTLRDRLLRAGWADHVQDIDRAIEEEVARRKYSLHHRARILLPHLLGQRIRTRHTVVEFDPLQAMGWLDEDDDKALRRLADRPCCLVGFDGSMLYVTLDDDRWLVLHGDWGNCIVLPSTETMLLWLFDWKSAAAVEEAFTTERLAQLGVSGH